MSDERFDQVDARLDRVDARLEHVDTRLDRVDARLEHVDTRLDRVDARLDRLEAGQNELRTHLDDRIDELGQQMRVLHEDVIDRIAATRESPGNSAKNRQQASADDVDRRLDPLEALVPVVKEHGVTLRRHDADIERLKRRRRGTS